MSEKWIQLFDGKSLDGWRGRSADGKHEWCAAGEVTLKSDDPKLFDIEPGDGLMVNGAAGRTADLYTDCQHGDCKLHIEFAVPQGSNSGVYFMGRYEIQVLDSWGETELKFGTCGGIYSRWINEQSVGGHPPRINVSKPPGEWQAFDIEFRAPRFDENGNKIANATFVSVIWNGEIVHENEESEGPTRASMLDDEAPKGPLMLQGDHGPVAYRNIRILDMN
jgi:3-keto-disaccharide hydrolase